MEEQRSVRETETEKERRGSRWEQEQQKHAEATSQEREREEKKRGRTRAQRNRMYGFPSTFRMLVCFDLASVGGGAVVASGVLATQPGK